MKKFVLALAAIVATLIFTSVTNAQGCNGGGQMMLGPPPSMGCNGGGAQFAGPLIQEGGGCCGGGGMQMIMGAPMGCNGGGPQMAMGCNGGGAATQGYYQAPVQGYYQAPVSTATYYYAAPRAQRSYYYQQVPVNPGAAGTYREHQGVFGRRRVMYRVY